jgi:hypothetical protein
MSGNTEVLPAALGISYKVTLDKDGRREIVMQGHLPINAPAPVVNELLDRIARAGDRQAAVYELQRETVEHDRMVAMLYELDLQIENTRALSQARWEQEKRHGEWSEKSLSPKEQQALDGISSSRIKYTERIKQARETIAQLRKVIADAVDGCADRDAGMPES